MSDMDIDRNLRCKIADLTEECKTLRGEHVVLVRLLIEADKLLGTIEGECQEEWDMLSDLRRAIAAATIPQRPDEAGLLAIRVALCPHQHAIDDWRNSGA